MSRSKETQANYGPPKPLPPKPQILSETIRHIDITQHNVVPLVDAMAGLAFSSRDLNRASRIFDKMLADTDCAIILCLAGSMVSAGLKHVIVEMIEGNMVDAIVSTGANIVDQDFFEALGYKHYVAPEEYKSGMYDDGLRELMIDRIYDTFIDEEELRVCDDTVRDICNELEPRPYSSREFIWEMGRWLENNGGVKGDGRSVVHSAFRKGVPIYVPAFSDCSAGFGMIQHQKQRIEAGESTMLGHDSARDFYELCLIKDRYDATGLFMIGGGVPKNFAQDIAVAADIFGKEPSMHKYAIQVTVADARDGALSGSTLKEACSWGKVDIAEEQMVYSEATLAVPLIVGYGYHKRNWENRKERRLAGLVEQHLRQAVAAG